MNKTLTIKIKPAHKAMADFREAFRAVETGRRVRRREGVYFTSIEAARNLLTPSRLALLRSLRTKRPRSIYELAKTLKRDFKNVQEDLRILERYGLVRVAKSRGSRRARVPEALFGEIALRIAI
ncbi:MAG: helix-turn-helix domain-containing protein [Deltaproteobacteria bacterium]|nr:helix-turn-helix domain-containing protein [Deltaproteobacteria bacterium]